MRRNRPTAERFAEFLGTFTLFISGLAVVAHSVLRNAVGDPLPAPGAFGNVIAEASSQAGADRSIPG